jgi:hypothetical protein
VLLAAFWARVARLANTDFPQRHDRPMVQPGIDTPAIALERPATGRADDSRWLVVRTISRPIAAVGPSLVFSTSTSCRSLLDVDLARRSGFQQ